MKKTKETEPNQSTGLVIPTHQITAIIMRSLETGNFIPLAIAGLVAYLVKDMTPQLRAELLRELIHSTGFAVAGWVAFIVSLFFSHKQSKRQDVQTEHDLKRISEERDILVKKQLELPLDDRNK